MQSWGGANDHNVQLDVRQVVNETEHVRSAAAELIALAPDVIVVSSNPALAVLQKMTTTISIVFVQVSDPVGTGFVAGLAKPGANITGFQNFEPAMGGKWLGLLKEATPAMTRAAMLMGPDTAANVAFLHAAEAVAPSLGIEVATIDVRDIAQMERGIDAFAAKPDGGLIVLPHPSTIENRTLIIAQAARHRLPAVYPYRYFATSGGMISYGIDQLDQWRGAASYVDRILRGAKPGDLPVQAPTRFELIVNLKTAKALGITIPPAFPLRADEVIE